MQRPLKFFLYKDKVAAGKLGRLFSSGYRNVVFFPLENIAALNTHLEEGPCHELFYDFLVTVADPGKAYFVAFIVFGYYVEILNFACAAFNAVTLHAVPPLYVLSVIFLSE